MKPMTVKATREGLQGQRTTSGWIINNVVPFVALPSHAALGLWVRVWNPAVTDPATGSAISTKALVLDVGPWFGGHNDDDDAYVFGGARPKAETETPAADAAKGLKSNGAGIDLGEAVRAALKITDDNVEVSWEFV
jgi:hypothetical protein